MARKRIRGTDKVLRNLNREIKQIEGRTMKGLIRAGIIVLRDMDKTSPKIPVDERNLQASQFLVATRGGVERGSNPSFKGENAERMQAEHSSTLSREASAVAASKQPVVRLGFSANYAWYVHEMVGANFQRPGAGAKFFE